MEPLPIDAHLPRITAALRERPVVLVAEPGAGKTTRVPRALLETASSHSEIVVVEPRRIAARMAAARVATELGEEVGGTVGYRVRFEQRTSARTRATFVTEGVLARRLDSDPMLRGVGCVVFDELHERSLAIDLALARVRRLAERRPELRIVAMSATLEAEPVVRFLDGTLITVEGRTHPVAIRYAERPDDRPLERRVRAAVVRLFEEKVDGDVLVFLPGAAEIRRAKQECEGPASSFGFDVMPLHGELSREEQERAVRRGARPKVVLSTNVAETSLTLEGVVAVIDSGLARVSRFSPWTGLASLDTAPISRASATQRAGRAGRVRPGVCVRLYTRADHDARPERDKPEIQRADLCEAVLSLLAAGEDPRGFPYFEPPPPAALDAAFVLLERLGAVDRGAITALGREMLAVPVHPRLARIALEAASRGHRETGAMLAALIAERDVRRPVQFEGRSARTTADVAASDVLERLFAIEAAGEQPSSLRAADLDPHAVKQARRAAEHIARALPRQVSERESFDEEDALLIATLAGFPDRVARRRGDDALVLAQGGSARLHPQSAVRDAELLVAIDAQAHGGSLWVRQASATKVDHLLELFLDRLSDVREMRFDPAIERVIAVAELRYDGLVLERTTKEASGPECARVLADAALAAGIERFVDRDAFERLKRRLDFARRFDETIPTLDDALLRDVLLRLCEGRKSFAELAGAGVLDWVRAELGPATARLDALAPESVPLPARKSVRVNYEVDRAPWIESRLQDFFGATEGPRVARGAEPLVLHLLAPNKRAVQVTTDLAGFWARHYPSIRKELMRRYPRHKWPEDPRRPPAA